MTLLRKRLKKAENKLNNREKKISTAGQSLLDDKQRDPDPEFISSHLEKRKKNWEAYYYKTTTGINGMFIIKTLYNLDLLNIYTDIIVSVDHEFKSTKRIYGAKLWMH